MGSEALRWAGRHGCNSGSAHVSPCQVAIEKAQAELRQEYDVREERRRQLEFLEKGGNPLDFKLGNAVAVSVQSTSLTDQRQEQFVTSEAKGSFVLTASPHGDSVDSSARPGAPSISEPNTADNLLLFDGENELPEGEKRSLHSNRRNNIAPSEQSSQIGVSQNTKETEDSAIFRPYARRNRSRPNHGPRGGSRDGKGLLSDTNKQKDQNVPSVSKPKPVSLNGEIFVKDPATSDPLDNEIMGLRTHQTNSVSTSLAADKLDITLNRNFKEDQRIVPSQDDTVHNPLVLAFGKASAGGERNPGASGELELSPRVAAAQPVDESCPGQTNGFGNIKVDRKGAPTEDQNSSVAVGLKSFDPESCCAQTSLARDVNNDTDMCTNTKNADANGTALEQTLFEKKLSSTASEAVKERSKTNIGENGTTAKNEHAAGYVNHSGSGSNIKNEEDFHMNSSSMQNKLKDSSSIRGHHSNDSTVLKADKGESVVMVDHSNSTKDDNCERLQVSKDLSIATNPQSTLADKVTTAASDCQPCSPHHLKLADKAHEDSILEEARIIEVKRKRIMELSAHALPSPILRKSHWDFVLEEMAWLANDFAQERLWKTTAASVLANAVMQFWDSVELLLDKDIADHEKVDSSESSRDKRKNSEMESSNCMEGQNARKIFGLKVHFYAMRYIMDRRSHEISSQTEGPASPDKISDSGTVDMSRVENLTENSRCAKYRLPDVHEKEKPTTSGQHAGGNDAGFEVGERSSTDKCCNICWKGVEEIVKYGLFPNCDHLFCHGCISRWRCNGSACWKIMKSCPTCRAFSFFVIPSTKWLAGDAKATYIKNYMQRCSSIDCRYFLHGDGYCPQRHHCFYRHVVHPGTYRWMHHRSPPPPQPEVDEEVAADTITDFEIGIRPEAKDRIIQGTIPPSCISCSFFFLLILKLVSDPRIE